MELQAFPKPIDELTDSIKMCDGVHADPREALRTLAASGAK